MNENLIKKLKNTNLTEIKTVTRGGYKGIPRRRGRQPVGGANMDQNLPNFPKNCMKLRKFWSVGGAHRGRPPWIRHWSLNDSLGLQRRIYIVKFWTRAPPQGPKCLSISCSLLGNFGKIICWRPPGELAPPPRGNPGSATGLSYQTLVHLSLKQCTPSWKIGCECFNKKKLC